MRQKEFPSISETNENIHGIIRFYDPGRTFGLIDSDNGTYIFFNSGFRNKVTRDEISESERRSVTFSLKKDIHKEGRFIAFDIIFK
jgi:hypothetical protein